MLRVNLIYSHLFQPSKCVLHKPCILAMIVQWSFINRARRHPGSTWWIFVAVIDNRTQFGLRGANALECNARAYPLKARKMVLAFPPKFRTHTHTHTDDLAIFHAVKHVYTNLLTICNACIHSRTLAHLSNTGIPSEHHEPRYRSYIM